MVFGDKEPEGQCISLKPAGSHRRKALSIRPQNSKRMPEIY